MYRILSAKTTSHDFTGAWQTAPHSTWAMTLLREVGLILISILPAWCSLHAVVSGTLEPFARRKNGETHCVSTVTLPRYGATSVMLACLANADALPICTKPAKLKSRSALTVCLEMNAMQVRGWHVVQGPHGPPGMDNIAKRRFLLLRLVTYL